MSFVRSAFVIVLLFVGAVLALTANATVWANRTVFNTDNFVETANRALDDEEVQAQLATRLSVLIVEQSDLQARVHERLPEGMKILAPVLTRTAQDLLYDIVIRLLNNETVRDGLEKSLRAVHEQLLAILEDESALVIQEDAIVIDLQVILDRALERLNVDPENPITLPEQAGQIVLVEDVETTAAVQDLLALHSTITWLVVALAAGAFALAVAVSPRRRATLRDAGIVLSLCGVLAVMLLWPLRPIAAALAENPGAAKATFDAFFYDYRLQSFLLVVLGVGLVVLAALLGQGEMARAVKGRVRPRAGETAPTFADAIRANATLLRIVGLVAGALTLAAWPEPTNRVRATVLLLLVLWFVALWLVTSTSDWAERARTQIGAVWNRTGDRNETFFGRNISSLRVAGIVGAVVIAILVPNLGFGSLVAIVALALLYWALVDWLSVRDAA